MVIDTANFTKYLATQLSEPSTYTGLTVLLTLAGVYLSPDQKEAIITVGTGIAAALHILIPEKGSQNAKTDTPPAPKS